MPDVVIWVGVCVRLYVYVYMCVSLYPCGTCVYISPCVQGELCTCGVLFKHKNSIKTVIFRKLRGTVNSGLNLYVAATKVTGTPVYRS